MRSRALTAVALALCLLGGGLGLTPARAAVPNPTVDGPIGDDVGIRGHALFDSWFELEPLGYEEAEYFVSGTARRMNPDGTAPYTTRIIVTRPRDAKDFNGTVLLDWVNVSLQFENAVDTIEAHEMLLRDGYAVVHVSAQAAGICCNPLTPKTWDPVRYAPLTHPGDDYAYDMFSQVAQAVRSPRGVDPMDGLRVERVLAAGQSQGGFWLRNYVAVAQPQAKVIDGFLIHGAFAHTKEFPAPLSVPVLQLLSDSEADPSGPDPSPNYRLWEIAGSAHTDFWLDYHQEMGQGPRALASAPKRPASADEEMHAVAGNYGEQIHPRQATCVVGGSLFPMRYATSAAIHRLDQWVRRGTPPRNGPRFQFDGDALATDEYGNALGGIRLPPIEVPVARYESTACDVGGITIPFTEVELRLLYPTHADYYARMIKAIRASLRAGFLLRADAQDLRARACAAKIRWQELTPC